MDLFTPLQRSNAKHWSIINRDRKVDEAQGLRTIANILTEKNAIYLSIFLLIVAVFCAAFLHVLDMYNLTDLLAIIGSYMISSILILKSQGKSEFYFLGKLDGMIMLHGLFIIASRIVYS